MSSNDGQIKIGIEADGAALESYLNKMDKTAARLLAGVTKESKELSGELDSLNKALKLDPQSTVLLTQKQELLAKSVQNASEKVAKLTSEQERMSRANAANPAWEKQMGALISETEKAQNKLSSLTSEKQKLDTALSKSSLNIAEYDKLCTAVDEAEKSLKELSRRREELANKEGAISTQEYQDLDTAVNAAAEELEALKTKKKDCDTELAKSGTSAEAYKELKSQINEAKNYLKELSNEQKNVEAQFKDGHLSDSGYRDFQRDVALATAELKDLEKAAESSNLAVSGFGKATAGIGEMSGKISEAAGKFGNAVMPLSNATADIGVAAVKAGMDFEAGMSQVAAVSGASGNALEALKEKAKEIGVSTKFSATEASEALNYMAMAGWDTSQMLDGISGIMDLAAASGENLGSVSDIVTDALTAFGLSAKDSGHFADVLAQASSSSNTNVSMMGATFKYVAPLAGALNYSVEDVGVAIGLMANAGIKGEQAGTSLRGMLSRLIKPTSDVEWAMGELGLSIANADGTMKPFKQIVDDMRVGFSGMSEAGKANVATNLAGQEAMSGLLAIVNASDADYQKLTQSINNADGATARMAETMQDNLAGDFTMLGSQLEGLGIQASEILVPSLREAADGVSGFLDWLSQLPPGAQKAILSLGGLVAAAGPVAKSVEGVGKAVQGLMTIIATPGGAIAGGIAIAIGAIAVVADLAIVTAEEQRERLNAAQAEYERTSQEMQDTNDKIAETEKRIDELNKKDKLTFVEKEELAKLDELNRSLLIKTGIASREAARAAEKLVAESSKTFKKLYGDFDVTIENVQQRIQALTSEGLNENAVVLDRFVNDAASAVARIIQAREKLSDPLISKKDSEYWGSMLDRDMETVDQKLTQMLNDKAQMIEIIELAKAAGTPHETTLRELDQLDAKIKDIMLQTDPSRWQRIAFDEIMGTEGIQETIDKLKELADTGELTAETLNSPEYADFKAKLEESGLTADDFVENLQALSAESGNTSGALDGIAESADSVEDSFSRAVEAADRFVTLQGQIEALSDLVVKVNKEITENGEISQATLSRIVKDFPELSDLVSDYYMDQANAPALIKGIMDAESARTESLKNDGIARKNTYLEEYETLAATKAKLIETGKQYNADMVPIHKAEIEAIEAQMKEIEEKRVGGGETVIEAYTKKCAETLKAKEPEITNATIALIESPTDKAAEVAKSESGIVGGYAINGYVGKIEEGVPRVEAALRLITNATRETMKQELGIHSPSKVTQKLGNHTVDGYVLGIEERKGQVQSAFDSILGGMLERIGDAPDDYRSAASACADAFKDGLESQNDATLNAIIEMVNAQAETMTFATQEAADEYKTAAETVINTYKESLALNAEIAVTDINDKLQIIADTAQTRYDEIISQREAMAKKLADYGDLFTTKTVEKTVGGITTKVEEIQLGDLDQQINTLKNYDSMLTQIRDRGVSDEFLNEITSLGVDQGVKFSRELLNLTDSEFDAWVGKFKQKQELSKKISDEFYAKELEKVEKYFVGEMGKVLNTMPEAADKAAKKTVVDFGKAIEKDKKAVGDSGKVMIDALSATAIATANAVAPSIGAAQTGAIAKSITDNKGTVTEAGKAMLTSASADMKPSATAGGKTIGEAIVEGLIAGMEGKQSELASAWQRLAEYSSNESRSEKAFDVNSPSKLTIPIGEALPEGMAVGVEKQKSVLQKAMNSLAEMTAKSKLNGDFKGAVPALSLLSSSNTPPQTNNNDYGLTVNLTYTGEATRQEARDFGKELGNRMSRTLRERGITIPL